MNEKEIAEIRRRFNPQKSNITAVCGCLVNEKNEIVSEFRQPVASMMQDEAEALLSLLKRSLSGGIGRNLLETEFSNEEVMHGERHKRLMELRDCSLKNDALLHSLFESMIPTIHIDGTYLILTALDAYDVFSYSEDGEKSEDSSEVFRYIITAVCPIKLTKPMLSFAAFDSAFHSIAANSVVAAPEIGFMFPSFDDRQSNIYNALFYTKDTAADHSETVDALFGSALPLPAKQQKDSFSSVLSESIGDDCSLEVIRSVNDAVGIMVAEHKESGNTEPLTVSKEDIGSVLRSCNVTDEHIEQFSRSYSEAFGESTRLSPQNIIDTKHYQLTTPEVSIKVDPEFADLVSAKKINGVPYILIRADQNVEVNGVPINIGDAE